MMKHLHALLLLAVVLAGGARAQAMDERAVAAAQRFFDKLDRGNLSEAYAQFSPGAKALIPFEAWLESHKDPAPVVVRHFTKSVSYDRPEGVLVAVEFNGKTAGGDVECGYVVVDTNDSIVRTDSTRVPAEALTSGMDDQLANALKDLPGCH